MGTIERKKWWNLIKQVAKELDKEKIPYHFDASTSLFVQGIEFDMDDIDVVIQKDYFEKAHSYFKRYNVSYIENSYFSQCFFTVDNMKVHLMTYEDCINFSEDNERVKVKKDDQVLWAKSVEFYRRNHSDSHPLAGLIDMFLAQKNKE